MPDPDRPDPASPDPDPPYPDLPDPDLLGAIALSQAIHARELSCVEVMADHLDRIARLNPVHNAIVSLRPADDLLAEAAAAEAELAAGRSRGWLHGIPQAPKDLTETAGIATVRGSPLFRDQVPRHDSILVERLRHAGAILIGKTNVPEFGLGSHSYNPVFGTTRNAIDPRLSAGGSSGGAAVALATGMLAVADGSDMMGSLRNPAGWNGVFGFRPSFGRVPRGPVPELYLDQISTEGPMARDVADLAMLFSTIAGHDPRVPMSLDGDGAGFAHLLVPATRGLRIGWLGDLGGHLPMQPGVLETCEAALRVFEDLGAIVTPLRPGFAMERLWECWTTLRSWLIAASLGALWDNPASRAQMKPEAIWEIERGRSLGVAQVHAASMLRSAWHGHLLGLFAEHDFLILPTAQLFPFDAGLDWPREIASRAMDSYHRWMEVVVPASLAGVPVLAAPAGTGPDGLPMGIQIIGPPRADRAVLELGHAYDLARPRP